MPGSHYTHAVVTTEVRALVEDGLPYRVDNCIFPRLIYKVLDHDSTKKDVERFFIRFKAVLDARGLILHGIMDVGSPLYPEPIGQVFGDISYQICELHILAELTKAALKAVTKTRRSIKAKMPKLLRGRSATTNNEKRPSYGIVVYWRKSLQLP